MKRDDIYWEATRTKDHRFDGKFFVGVKTTGIYCRPICPAKPKRENVEFFPNPFAAENAGYRPCLRCRPESAPQSPAWIGTSAIVQRAVKKLHDQETIAFDEDRFAGLFGVSARHLRRLFVEEIGKTPKQISFENRLNLSRKLIVETSLKITEVAYASGFRSLRRFNDAFKDRFKKSPTEIRRSPVAGEAALTLTLPYRPPFDFEGLLHYYRGHQVGDLERFEAGKMHRVIEFGGRVGQITIANDALHSKLLVAIDFPDLSMIPTIVARVRGLFDLDSDPVVIANHLETNPAVKNLLKKYPGIRLFSGWHPFEVSVAAILGQVVSVKMGRTLVADLIEKWGEDSGLVVEGRAIKLFPTPAKIAAADLSGLRTTASRKEALIGFAKAVAEKKLSLEPTQDVDEFVKNARAIKGIGPWTASYMAMKALRHTDAFPDTDLILGRALALHPKEMVATMSPWRGYVAALFWREYSDTLKKTSRRKR